MNFNQAENSLINQAELHTFNLPIAELSKERIVYWVTSSQLNYLQDRAGFSG